MKKPSLLKRFLDNLPKKGTKMPRNLKISASITGTLQVALTALGTAVGVTSAATFPGMVGLGIVGFVVGNVAGGLIGLAAFTGVIAYNLHKAAKKNKKASAAAKKAAPAPEAQKPAAPVADKQLKSEFKAANENKAVAEQSAQKVPEQKAANPAPKAA